MPQQPLEEQQQQKPGSNQKYEQEDWSTWNLRSVLKSWAISLTNLWKGSFLINSSVLFWYLLISLRATVPGLNLWGFLIPPEATADFLAALLATCFLGALPLK